jgi:hypothetical protein
MITKAAIAARIAQRKTRLPGLNCEPLSKQELDMTALSHRIARLSIQLICGAVGLAGAVQLATGSSLASNPAPSPYFGRWVVSEDKPVFTAKGRLYKTVDIAACGRDFCGVSVDDRGRCGGILFRFLMAHADASDSLRGHGQWGGARKNVVLDNYEDSDVPGTRRIELYLGDGYDFGGRSDNMPKFHANYRKTGRAQCTAH